MNSHKQNLKQNVDPYKFVKSKSANYFMSFAYFYLHLCQVSRHLDLSLLSYVIGHTLNVRPAFQSFANINFICMFVFEWGWFNPLEASIKIQNLLFTFFPKYLLQRLRLYLALNHSNVQGSQKKNLQFFHFHFSLKNIYKQHSYEGLCSFCLNEFILLTWWNNQG